MLTSSQIRQQFIDFFRDRGHTPAPPSPVVPHDDPTLMFTNAGMNQFKDVFLGIGSRSYRRAVNSQKCIRVSGKHNDLEEVGRDSYHHTFFEMLGNWSFGDYFKAEAIRWAWELLTEVYGLEKRRLHATVFGGDETDDLEPDEEAARLWMELTDIDPSHVHRFGRKDNFWEMGETGPCGPCSEIHIDLTPDYTGRSLVNADDPSVIELWNLVFIQFNRDAEGKLSPLPAKHVDTGLGFERLCRVLQGKLSNYDTDLFMPIISRIAQITGKEYTGRFDRNMDTAFRVVADHIRMLTFAITDGCRPSNEGRGYVVRRILRRAARFGRQYLEMNEPFIYLLVPTVVDVLAEAFPEIARQPQQVMDILKEEEASFGRTLGRGIKLLLEAARQAKEAGSRLIDGPTVFRLYDEAGFPIDLTRQMAEEHGLDVDQAQFDRLMQQKRQKDRAAAKGRLRGLLAFEGQLPATDDHEKWSRLQAQGTLLGWLAEGDWCKQGKLDASAGQVGLVLDRTCFYAEAGGQIGDTGKITTSTGTFLVDDTQGLGDAVVHLGRIADGWVEPGQICQLHVDPDRMQTARHHTTTHLLHWALREVLGEHVTQRGSLVEPERLRFDFDHSQDLSDQEVNEIERLVNDKIWQDLEIRCRSLPRDEALSLPGVRAFFGEKYGQTVRIVEVGDGFSRELCGGTHLERTGQAGPFVVVSQELIAKGVRRITAVAGEAAIRYVQWVRGALREAAGVLRCAPDEVCNRIDGLQHQLQSLRKQLSKAASEDLKSVAETLLRKAERVGQTSVVVGEVPAAPPVRLREILDWLRKRAGSAAILIGCKGDEGKVMLLAAMTPDVVERGLHAGEIVKTAAALIGGTGGGKPDLAQAGGKRPDQLDEALAAGRRAILGDLSDVLDGEAGIQ